MKNQFEVFSAVLNNFDTAIQATETAENSQGSAMEENARQSESLQAKIQELKAQFQEFVLGDGGLAKFIKLLIEAGTAILKFANSGVGQAIIKLVALKSTFDLLNKGFNSFLAFGTKLEMLQGGFTKAQIASALLNKEFVGLDVAIQAVGASVLKTAKAWIASPFGQVTLVVGSVIAIKKIIDELTVSFEEQKDSLNNSIKEYEESSNKVEEANRKLKDIESQIEKIKSLDGIDITNNEELQNLEAEKEELEYILSIERERERIAREKLQNDAQAMLNKKVSDSDAFGSVKIGAGGRGYEQEFVKTGTTEEAVSSLTDKLSALNIKLSEAKDKEKELADEQKGNTEEYKKAQNEVESLKSEYDRLSSKTIDYVDTLQKATKGLDKNSDEYKAIIGILEDYSDVTGKHISILEDDEEATKEQEKNIKRFGKTLGNVSSDSLAEMNEATQDQQDLISSLASNIDEITNAYQTAVNAIAEYNNQGYLSVDTYSQLMQVAPQYLATLIDENGQFYANADGVTTLYQAQVYEMGVTAARAQVNLASSLSNEAGAYANLGNQAIDASGGIWELVKAEMAEDIARVEDPRDLEALQNRINAINNLTQSTIKNAKATTSSIQPTQRNTRATRGNTGAHKGNTGARKKNTSATKAQTSALKAQKKALEDEADALEKQIKEYEIVIDYVKDLLKEEQEAVENQKDKELQAIKDKMDALEDEQEAFENNIEIQINLLEKQRDEQEKYWDDQINGIKDANKELEDNIKLQQLQEALAYARTQKVKVLKGGEFVYVEDTEAISKAEQELADYEQQLAVQRQIEELERLKEEALNSLDKQVEDLENYRDRTKDNYDQQLKDLQDHYDKVEQEYDYRIAQYDAWLKQFEDMLNASARRHAQILYNELVGEQGNWDARIKALGKFVNDYDYKKKQLDGIKNQINAITNQISGLEAQARSAQANVGRIRSGVANDIASINRMKDSAQLKYIGYVTGRTGANLHHTDSFLSSQMAQEQAELWIKHYGNSYWASQGPLEVSVASHYNQGTYSVAEDQIAVVGDPTNPNNRELAVGARINRGDGILTKLQKGTGIIPHGHTLTENLIGLARWSQNGGLERVINNQNSNSSSIINIGTINLPQVQNGEDFVSYLESNFLNDSIQFSNIRR